MDVQTAVLLIPKLNALRAFLTTVDNGGEHLNDDETRHNYRQIYADIKATVNDPNLEIYAPPLPHLGTFMGDVPLQGYNQARILDSGISLITYLDSQLQQAFPRSYKPKSDSASQQPLDASTSYIIKNFQGILGNVENSAVTQNLELSIVKGDFEKLRKKLSELKIEHEDVDELQVALESETVISERDKFGPKVSAWIGKMVQKAAMGAWDISINTAGNILAILIANYYGL